jgi:hypothetical protein
MQRRVDKDLAQFLSDITVSNLFMYIFLVWDHRCRLYIHASVMIGFDYYIKLSLNTPVYTVFIHQAE